MNKFYNRTRVSKSIPLKLLLEGKPYLIPLYYLMLTSELANEGIRNSGSYKFADHIYRRRPKGKFIIGYLLDAILLNLKSAKSFRSRYLYSKEEIHRKINEHSFVEEHLNILAVPSGLARELFEVADELKNNNHPHYQKIKFHGIDLDKSLVTYLNKRSRQSKHNINFFLGDALSEDHYPKNQSYDIIISMGLTEFLNDDDTVKFYALAKRKLKKSGRLVTSGMIPHRLSDYLLRNIGELHTYYRSKEQLEVLAKQAGFENIKMYQDTHKLQTMLIASQH